MVTLRIKQSKLLYAIKSSSSRTNAFYAYFKNNDAPNTKRVALVLCVLIVLHRYKIVDGQEKEIVDERMFVIPTEKDEEDGHVYPDKAKRGECLVRAHLLLLSV